MISVSKLFEDDNSIQKIVTPVPDQKEDQTVLKLITKPIKKIRDIFIGNPGFSGEVAGTRG